MIQHPTMLPSQCVCNKTFKVEHALSCPYGGFPSIRHNKLRDLTAHLITEVCHNVGIKPELQPVTSERLQCRSANLEEGSRLDIMFLGTGQAKCIFDIRVFNPLTPTYHNQSLAASYHRNEQEKIHAYEQRIQEVEHGYFSPSTFSASSGMGPTAKVVYKKLASMIALKHDKTYSQTINWMRCRLSFSLL